MAGSTASAKGYLRPVRVAWPGAARPTGGRVPRLLLASDRQAALTAQARRQMCEQSTRPNGVRAPHSGFGTYHLCW
jgi:hypothetical protein